MSKDQGAALGPGTEPTGLAGVERDVAPAAGYDLWEELGRAVAGHDARPKLRPDVEVVHLPWVRHGRSTLVAREQRVLSLEARDAAVLALLDGGRSLAELVVDDSLAGTLRPARIRALVERLRAAGFLTSSSTDVGAELDRALHPQTLRRRAAGALGTLSVRTSRADRPIRALHRLVGRFAFMPPVALLLAAVAVAGVVSMPLAVASHHYRFVSLSPGAGFAVLLLADLLAVALHELGHGIAVVHYGRRVKAAGVRLYYGAPTAFLEVPEALLLSRRQRVIESAAGPAVDLVIAGAISVVLAFLPLGGEPGDIAYRFALLTYLLVAINLVPLLELDGYWIFTDLVGITDLRRRAAAFLRRTLWDKLARRERLTRLERNLLVYALAGVAFALACLAAAAVSWERTFGTLVAQLWHDGGAGVVLLGLLALVVVAPLVQALAGSLASLERRLATSWRRARFRLERSWRIEAARRFDSPELFEDLPEAVLNQLAGRVRLVAVGAGEAIVRQGDPADAYFVLRSGSAEIAADDALTGEEHVLARLGEGDGFGELGLLRHEPRSATVRALERCELFAIDRGSFERLLLPYLRPPAIGITLAELAELAAVPVLAGLGRGELLALATGGDRVDAAPGCDLVVEGDAPDGFYVLLEGQASVSRGGEQLATLGPGSYFGEVALLRGGVRTATVRTLTYVRAFRVTPRGFDELLARSSMLAGGSPPRQDAGLAALGHQH